MSHLLFCYMKINQKKGVEIMAEKVGMMFCKREMIIGMLKIDYTTYK